MDDPQDDARERSREKAESVEQLLESVDPALEQHAYPVERSELAARYAETPLELPNDTESLGDVFDRLADERYDSAAEAKVAVLNAVTDETNDPTVAGVDHAPTPGTETIPAGEMDDPPAGSAGQSGPEAPPEQSRTPDDPGAVPGDELTSDTTERGEFAPGATVEDVDREDDEEDSVVTDVTDEVDEE